MRLRSTNDFPFSDWIFLLNSCIKTHNCIIFLARNFNSPRSLFDQTFNWIYNIWILFSILMSFFLLHSSPEHEIFAYLRIKYIQEVRRKLEHNQTINHVRFSPLHSFSLNLSLSLAPLDQHTLLLLLIFSLLKYIHIN